MLNIYLKSGYRLKNLDFKSLKTRRMYVKNRMIRISTNNYTNNYAVLFINILSLLFYPESECKIINFQL